MAPEPPRLRSGDYLLDAAYAKAHDDVIGNIVAGRLVAGKRWSQIWTRDSAYAIDLGMGLGLPDVAEATLRAKTNGHPEVWTQDAARHFGAWPHLTDSIVGTIGAWAVYLATGDEDFLRWSHAVTVSSLTRAEQTVFDHRAGLFRGCASFMESNSAYPFRYQFDGLAVGRTKALSTNLLYYRAYRIAATMSELLGTDPATFEEKAVRLRHSVNRRLWMPERGLYAYYEDGRGRPSSRMEGLGEALAVLWGVAGDDQADAVLRRVPLTPHGIPCLWPRYRFWRATFNDANYYHNGMVWPFVQAYWALAAAHRRNLGVFTNELWHLAVLSTRAATFHEFYRPHNGRPDGSARQLWSAAGYLAMIHNGLFGITAEPARLTFRPLVPQSLSGLSLRGWRYRDMVLDISISGAGDEVASCALDGVAVRDNAVPIGLTGWHRVDLTVVARA